MIIKVIVVDGATNKFQKEVAKMARELEKLLSKKGLIEVHLIRGNKMRSLNKKFRNRDKTTNVLSFVTPKDFLDDSLGEVYIDPFYMKKNKEDLKLMLVHGVLHILGYDHVKNSDKIKMERKEANLLFKIRSIKS